MEHNRAAAVQKDQVFNRLDLVESNVVYLMNNACYKSYTLLKTLESIQKLNVTDNETINVVMKVEKM